MHHDLFSLIPSAINNHQMRKILHKLRIIVLDFLGIFTREKKTCILWSEFFFSWYIRVIVDTKTLRSYKLGCNDGTF